jgi:hypothetical protein
MSGMKDFVLSVIELVEDGYTDAEARDVIETQYNLEAVPLSTIAQIREDYTDKVTH